MNWIKRTLWEIDRSSSLAILGAILSVCFLVLYYFWSAQTQLFNADHIKPLLCWDFFPQCSTKVPIPGSWMNFLFNASVALSILSLILFVMRRSLGIAWFFTFLTWGIYLSVYAIDASLRTNIIGFFILFVFSYLFIPNKQKLSRYLILAFYLIDCYTKINPEWLSGMPLYGSINVPEKGLEWIASFSVLIQLILPFFLISRDGQRLSYGFGALFLYHLFHFYTQRDPGHLIMAALLLFFVFDFFEFKRIQRETMYQSYEHPEPSSIWWPAIIAIFCGSQLVYAEGRFPLVLFQMQKPVGSLECILTGYANYQNKVVALNTSEANVPSNFKCHPMVNFNLVKTYCDKMKSDSSFDNVTAFFLTRKLSDETYQVQFSSDRFCDSSYNFSSRGGL